jgi:hypothetical protein
MTPETLLHQLQTAPASVEFDDVMTVIEENFIYTPTHFTNGHGDDCIRNAAGENEGSCKIFALGQLLQLTKEQTLACFGKYYRQDVLQNPDGASHANIRTFMRYGWSGIHFDKLALQSKQPCQH